MSNISLVYCILKIKKFFDIFNLNFFPKTDLRSVEKLILNSDLREEIGKNARIRVEKLYSITANRDTYLNILLNSFNKKI